MTEIPVPVGTEDPTGVFVEHRELLFGVVYNMLSSVTDTEDVLQDTWLSWSRRGTGGVDNPRAYLVRIAVNHALKRRAVVDRRRETYVGSWLPEPLVTEEPGADGPALRTESVSLAMLVVLESLSPLERAVFVLHEVFGYAHTEIAEIIDRKPAAVRQLAHRARDHVQARRPLYEAHPRVRREATERFVRAAVGGDIAELMEILAPDVTVWTDSGGMRKQALRPVHGRDKAARLLNGYARRGAADLDLELRHRRVNGDDAAVLFHHDSPYAVIVLDLTPEGDRVANLFVVTNPDKLTHVDKEEA
ncbi:RNA polymerase sigma factor SigJ [Streptomyces griseorubiginosus]|uniref:ECF RNA polymerase sigma factor SigJ n=1 Tax=Streptomyces griseorubiginosus TaxID=67304 RepID=A0AAI8KW14_9ACTN|nr:RNA polymerase sigma factor SigJ [Streptomyces griseorubiginosus]AYC36731.1 ECF RNA polymerase sigma factor SigJ [Streptomyces griseorubiginosus]